MLHYFKIYGIPFGPQRTILVPIPMDDPSLFSFAHQQEPAIEDRKYEIPISYGNAISLLSSLSAVGIPIQPRPKSEYDQATADFLEAQEKLTVAWNRVALSRKS